MENEIITKLQPLADTLHERMKQEKNKQGKTNQSISDATGVPLSTTAKFFSGALSNPGIVPVTAFAIELGLSLDDLMGLTPQSDSEQIRHLEAQLDSTKRELELVRHHNELLESGIKERKPVIFGLTVVCLLLAVSLMGYLTMDVSNMNFGFFTHEGVSVVGISIVATLLASVGFVVTRFVKGRKKISPIKGIKGNKNVSSRTVRIKTRRNN